MKNTQNHSFYFYTSSLFVFKFIPFFSFYYYSHWIEAGWIGEDNKFEKLLHLENYFSHF